MQADFAAYQHGFHFSNNTIPWSVGPVSGVALCGGMVYAALDYWYAGLAIPGTTAVPADGTPLQQYIFNRQLIAHNNTLGKFFDGWQSGMLREPELDKLARFIGASRPIPVCLYGGFKHGHHVLAYMFNPGAKNFLVYDPNYPDNSAWLNLENGGYRHSISKELWSGFFVDDSYSWRKPSILEGEMGWVRCMDCRVLYSPEKDAGPCPKGGPHNPQGSAKYRLAVDAGAGNQWWRKCGKCKGLYYGKNFADAGLCPAGGIHNPAGGKWYTLAIDGLGQGNWRKCVNCQSVFWLSGGGIGGLCPGGGMHKSDLTEMYTIPIE